MDRSDTLQAFQQARPALLGLAYRVLGSHADAEDAVQECFLKWQAADRSDIDTPAAWLATVCMRHCLDVLRAADRARVDYVGTWLPEPVRTPGPSADDTLPPCPERAATRASSIGTAFVLALQRLTPKERAAYLLREIFELPYGKIAATLDLTEVACRQLVLRSRVHVEQARVRHVTPPDRQRRLLSAFAEAVTTGSVERLAGLLSDDVRLSADGGGKVIAARRVMRGRAEVLRFIQAGLHRWWSTLAREDVSINGQPGWVLRDNDQVEAAVSFGYDEDGCLLDVFVVRNPDKLQRVGICADLL